MSGHHSDHHHERRSSSHGQHSDHHHERRSSSHGHHDHHHHHHHHRHHHHHHHERSHSSHSHDRRGSATKETQASRRSSDFSESDAVKLKAGAKETKQDRTLLRGWSAKVVKRANFEDPGMPGIEA